ncbi:MAG: PilZ domain-containing protein [Myxococcota bacterium]
MNAQTEKRRHPRIEVNLHATMLGQQRSDNVAIEVGNFAPGGIYVRTNQTLPTGTEVELRFRMIADRVCEARGRVVWQNGSGFGVAFEVTNEHMDLFTSQLIKLPRHLHLFYLADILHPELAIAA